MDFKLSSQTLEIGSKMDAARRDSVGSGEQFMQQQNFLLDSQGNSKQSPSSRMVGGTDETFDPSGVKSEPMDYEQSDTLDTVNKNFPSVRSHSNLWAKLL